MTLPLLIHALDFCAVWSVRILVVLAVAIAALWAAVCLLDSLFHRGGYAAAFVDFGFRECRRSPRKFWARMVWGAKEDEQP